MFFALQCVTFTRRKRCTALVKFTISRTSMVTVFCPGHGPLTTVGEEKAHNPFFAA